jgi:transcriptional regulator with XRE-family HTH domain
VGDLAAQREYSLMPETPKRIRNQFGARVRELREQLPSPRGEGKPMSQDDFAHHAGLHRTWVSAVERGERAPTLGNICALAKALGTTPSDLLEGIEAD